MLKSDKVFRTVLWVVLFLIFSFSSYNMFFNYPEYPWQNLLYSIIGGLLLSTAVMFFFAYHYPPTFSKSTKIAEEVPHGDFQGTLFFNHDITVFYEHAWTEPVISHNQRGVSRTSLPVQVHFGNAIVTIISPVECSALRIAGKFSIIIRNEFRQVLSIGNMEEK